MNNNSLWERKKPSGNQNKKVSERYHEEEKDVRHTSNRQGMVMQDKAVDRGGEILINKFIKLSIN